MKKTVLHVLKSSTYSGAENVVITIVKAMRDYFPDRYDMIYASPDGDIRRVLEAQGVPFEPLRALSAVEVRRVIKTYRPDIIHAHDFAASVICAAAGFGVPMISHLHNNPPWIKSLNLKTLAYRLVSARFSMILGVSDAIFDEFRFQSIRRKSKAISNPIDVESIRGKSLIRTNEPYFGDVAFLGRLTEPKNPQRFIRLVSEVSRAIPGVSAIMIGDGELRDECAHLIETLGLNKRIKMTGFMENPHPVLARSKILCMPSLWEGFGLAAVEALALGVPVVASPVGGLPGIVDENCGALCTDDESFITALTELLNDGAEWERKSRAAVEKADKLGNIQSYVFEINETYKHLG